MSKENEYYLFGFFKDMSSEDKMYVFFWMSFFGAIVIIISVMTLTLGKQHPETCQSKILDMNIKDVTGYQKLLMQCPDSPNGTINSPTKKGT